MELTIQGRNFEIDNSTKGYITRKLDRIGRHFPAVQAESVLVNHEDARRADQRCAARITMNVNGSVLRSKERAATATAAIDVASEGLGRPGAAVQVARGAR